MGARLVNVRLDPDRRRKANVLRERGISLSELVRDAIDERFAALPKVTSTTDVTAIVNEIFDRYPDPPDLRSRNYNVHDRRAARKAILRKIRPGTP